ncbi:MAG: VpsF family polysaccharide biosynthesis protein, partial [Hyphomicrobiaceae bacterium]|nr:VpsF family polysaccharide biosynthesis protein [Hyphomicrobiaceae bacterium]
WFSHTRPIEFADQMFIRHKGTMIFLITWFLLLFQIVIVQHKPFTPIIDTFIMPVVMLFVLTSMDGRGRLRLAHLLHFLMFANALLALSEFALGFRLTPLDAGGVIIEGDWRSSALLGHPLTNALMTGCYLIVLSLGGGRDLPWILRPVVFGISLLAMNAFGGRMALVALLGFLAVVYALQMIAPLNGGSSSRRNWLMGVLLVPLGIMAVVIGFEIGLFDQLLERFVNDNGSASARVYMFEVFRDLTWLDIMIGPDQDYVASLLRAQGVNFGIESFWVAFILSYGFIVSMVFFVGLFAFLYDVARASTLVALWPILYFLTVSSTSVSLSAKGTDLAILVVMILLLLPKKTAAPARATAPRFSNYEREGVLS